MFTAGARCASEWSGGRERERVDLRRVAPRARTLSRGCEREHDLVAASVSEWLRRSPHPRPFESSAVKPARFEPRMAQIARMEAQAHRPHSLLPSSLRSSGCRLRPGTVRGLVALPPASCSGSLRARSCRLRPGTHPASQPRSCLRPMLLFSSASCNEDFHSVSSLPCRAHTSGRRQRPWLARPLLTHRSRPPASWQAGSVLHKHIRCEPSLATSFKCASRRKARM
jgi:hypothetical protein